MGNVLLVLDRRGCRHGDITSHVVCCSHGLAHRLTHGLTSWFRWAATTTAHTRVHHHGWSRGASRGTRGRGGHGWGLDAPTFHGFSLPRYSGCIEDSVSRQASPQGSLHQLRSNCSSGRANRGPNRLGQGLLRFRRKYNLLFDLTSLHLLLHVNTTCLLLLL